MDGAVGAGAKWLPSISIRRAPVPAGGLPKPGPLAIQLRNDHLGYALTWFGLAAALAAVFAVWASREWYLKTAEPPRASL